MRVGLPAGSEGVHAYLEQHQEPRESYCEESQEQNRLIVAFRMSVDAPKAGNHSYILSEDIKSAKRSSALPQAVRARGSGEIQC